MTEYYRWYKELSTIAAETNDQMVQSNSLQTMCIGTSLRTNPSQTNYNNITNKNMLTSWLYG